MSQQTLASKRRPESAQDKLVKAYLRQHSSIFKACDELSEQVWVDPHADKIYMINRERLRQSSTNGDQNKIFEVYGDVVNELTAAFTNTELLQTGVANETTTQGPVSQDAARVDVLDICMAPGGFAKVMLGLNKNTRVYGLSLPKGKGGHPLIESQFTGLQDRFEIQYLDITMLVNELSSAIVPLYPEQAKFSAERPYSERKFDLVIADGAVLESHARSEYRTKFVEGVRLRASELILALQRIKSGGTFVMLLHHLNTWETVEILHDFRSFATVNVKKPTTSHKASSSFYMIAEYVRPTATNALASVSKWKRIWEEATLENLRDISELSGDNVVTLESKLAGLEVHGARATEVEVCERLEAFGPTLIEMGAPVWETQMEGLRGKTGRNAYRRRAEQQTWGLRGDLSREKPKPKTQGNHHNLGLDDSSTGGCRHSHFRTTDSEKGQAIQRNWNLKKKTELARMAIAKQDMENARRASATRIEDIQGKSSWRSRDTSHEDKADIAGLVERAGNVSAEK